MEKGETDRSRARLFGQVPTSLLQVVLNIDTSNGRMNVVQDEWRNDEMHNQLLEYLKAATGMSHHVIAVSLDVRGFSRFSMSTDSVDVALFISKLYLEAVRRFRDFDSEVFFKTTGDGLMICVPYSEDILAERFSSTISAALEFHSDFGELFAKSQVVNFSVPERIGIGISRGAACALLHSEGDESDGVTKGRKPVILDYSGHKLNLAARLQDSARPSGVVFEARKNLELLPQELQERFETVSLYVRSLAERAPLDVCIQKDAVELRPENTRPFGLRRELSETSATKAQLVSEDLPPYHLHLLGEPAEGTLEVRFRRRRTKSEAGIGKSLSVRLAEGLHFTVEHGRGKWYLRIDWQAINKEMPDFIAKATARTKFSLEAHYEMF